LRTITFLCVEGIEEQATSASVGRQANSKPSTSGFRLREILSGEKNSVLLTPDARRLMPAFPILALFAQKLAESV